jgi:type IV pilus assembly protein PilM
VGKVRDEDAEKLEVLLMSAREDTVNDHISLLKAAGLHCSCIDIVPCAVLRTAENVVGDDAESGIVTVEIGERAALVGISRSGQLLFSRSVHTGGAMITDAIAEALELDPEKAEKFKRKHGIDHRTKVSADFSNNAKIPEKDMPGVIFELCQEDLKSLSHEIKRSVNYFVTQFHDVKVDRVLLFGGGANLKGLPEFLADETGLRVDVGDPFVSVSSDNGELDEYVSKDRASFAVAMGLALREG